MKIIFTEKDFALYGRLLKEFRKDVPDINGFLASAYEFSQNRMDRWIEPEFYVEIETPDEPDGLDLLRTMPSKIIREIISRSEE